MARLLFVLLFLAVICPAATAQRDLKNIPVPNPDLERQTFVVPEGFEVNLFAADPSIAKPIQMNFDAAGRLWVVSSEVYPHIEPGAEARDRVLVIEDRDGDGTSDQTHVFASGLLIPTGVAPGDGGVYVANSTELLHFADDDGDLKADRSRVVLSGFGTEDTHHILHTLRWGHDGYLYFNQSIYIHSHIETPWGIRRLNAGGIWQFRPETLELGVFMRGLVNSWGHHFDRYGQSFATDGAGGAGINYVIPGAYYVTAANADRILDGLNPGSPKHCGLELIDTPMLPPEWQGCAITNDFRGHRVCRFRLSDSGSGFASQEQQEVIKSDHVAFRPIDVKVGPDGALYIADWYNPIIQHGEVDFRDDRRDHTHGRIWRVRWKGAPSRDRLDISQLDVTQLLLLLKDRDGFRRQMARQRLREIGPELVLPKLEVETNVALSDVDVSDETLLELLWAWQSQQEIHVGLLQRCLAVQTGQVRAAAVRVFSHWKHSPELASLGETNWKKLLADSYPRVRLEAVRALAFSPNEASERIKYNRDATLANAIELAVSCIDQPTDRFLDYAIWLTARELQDQWLPQFLSGELDFQNNIAHVLHAFQSIGRTPPLDYLMSRLSHSTSAQQTRTIVALALNQADAKQVGEIVKQALNEEDSLLLQTALEVTENRRLTPVDVEEAVMRTASDETSSLAALALRAVGQWKLQGAEQLLLAKVSTKSDQVPPALSGLGWLNSAKAVATLKSFAADNSQVEAHRVHSAVTLVSRRFDSGVDSVAELLEAGVRPEFVRRLVEVVVAAKNGDRKLAAALRSRKLSADVGRELLASVRSSGRPLKELENAIKSVAEITSRKTMTSAERNQILAMLNSEADPAEGERLYRSLGCAKCHAIGQGSGVVGPNLVSLGGSAQPDYILESLLNPNAKVKENYHTTVILTDDGKIYSGVQIQQSSDEIVLRDSENRLLKVSLDSIDEKTQGVSLMPEGLVDQLSDFQLASMVQFLSELGRTSAYTVSRRPLVRTYQVMEATPDAAYRLRRTSYASAAGDDPAYQWRDVESLVAGQLPLADIPNVSVRNRSAKGSLGVGFARHTLQTTGRSKLKVSVNQTDGLKLIVDGRPIEIASGTATIDVGEGEHRFTWTVDQRARRMPLEVAVEVVEATNIGDSE